MPGNEAKVVKKGVASTPVPAVTKPRPSTANASQPSYSAGNATGTLPAGAGGGHAHIDLRRFSLSYYDPNGTAQAYRPGDREFVLVADTFRVGLELLRRPDVKPYLVELGKRCVRAWGDPKNAVQYKGYTWPGDISKMDKYVDIFLNGIQNSPPAIIVDSSIGGTFAETVKDIGSPYAGNLENFLPQDAVSFGLNAKLVTSMVKNDAKYLASWEPTKAPVPSAYNQQVQAQDDRWQTLRFITSITWFHEFAHSFVTYLAGNAYADTPATATNAALTDPGDIVGESGFWLETQIFGGCAMLEPCMPSGDPSEALKVYLINDKNHCRDVSMKTIREMMHSPATYDLKAGIRTVVPWQRKKASKATQSAHTNHAGYKKAGVTAARKFMCYNLQFVRKTGEKLRVLEVKS